MRPGRMNRAAIRAVERYRNAAAGRFSGTCRFEPGCSGFAIEAFRTRSFLSAAGMTAWRLLRCNPLARRFAPGHRIGDPVAPGRGLRPNSWRTLAATSMLAGLFLLLTAPFAAAQSTVGGCVVSVNGMAPEQMTSTQPLVVQKGGSVAVEALAPTGTGIAPSGGTAFVTIHLIDPIGGVTQELNRGDQSGWSGSVSVDKYLRYGTGLYRVDATASGSGWSCKADGYIKLDGNPLAGIAGQAAAAATLIGAGGVVLSTGIRKPKAKGPSFEEAQTVTQPEEEQFASANQAPGEVPIPGRMGILDNWAHGKLKPDPITRGMGDGGCLLLAILGAFIFGGIGIYAGAGGGAAAIPSAARQDRHVWLRGHPVWGFLSGAMCGLGVAVLGQQYALWPLTVVNSIGLVVTFAMLGGGRAWLGRPLRVVELASTPAAPPAA
ncbi:MAG: membrane protein insertion efficiency factor YidD [Actinomycetota bacterium]